VSDLALQAIRTAIDRYGSAEVSADRLAALAGAPDLDPSGWAAIERWLGDHDLIVISRPDDCRRKNAAASIMAAR
jgi:hypothetical protein